VIGVDVDIIIIIRKSRLIEGIKGKIIKRVLGI